jgi:hypothetical protein
MPVKESRDLSEKERILLHRLLAHGTPVSNSYASQLPLVRVASRCGCGCPTISLTVGDRAASPRSPSVILSEARGVSPEGISFGIILHVREELISELEFYPVDGEGVFSIPDLDKIEFYTGGTSS